MRMSDKLQLLINPTGWFSKKTCSEDALPMEWSTSCVLLSLPIMTVTVQRKNRSDQDTFYCFKIKTRGWKAVKSIHHCRKINFQELKTDYFTTVGRKTAPISPSSGTEGMKNAANRREEILSLCFFPPRNPPSCSITDPRWICCSYSQTDTCGFWLVFLWGGEGFFFYLLGSVAADCAETFVIYAKTIQQTPDDKSTPASNIGMEGGGANTAKIGKLQHRHRNTGAF